MKRWFRSLHAQLFLWAVLPLTIAIVGIGFSGIYAHERTMRDFIADRNLELARLGARIVEDGLAHGAVGLDGRDLGGWLAGIVGSEPARLVVVNDQGRVLAHPDPSLVGADLAAAPAVAVALERRQGSDIVEGAGGEPVLVSFTPVHPVNWIVLVAEPVGGLVGPILRLPTVAPIAAAAAAIISLLILVFGWLTIVRPLQKLASAADQVSWGDFTAIARPVGGVQEVRDLHTSLTAMVERIEGYEAGVRDYLGAVARGQETERERMAHELHDGPVQDLIALAQQAEMAQRLLDQGEADRARSLLVAMRRAEVTTVEDLRRLIGDLRPAYLEDLGLVPAVEMLVAQARRRTDARVRLECVGEPTRYEPEIELAAYRIAQEALSNAVHHANANHIEVAIEGASTGLTLSVVDDGVGFTMPPRADMLTGGGHFGLVGMRERASRVGGSLHIDTAEREGTRVAVQLPARPDLV